MSDHIRIGIVGGGDARAIHDLKGRPIDSLWTGGHIASRNPSPEAMVGLVRLATLTVRVIVGTSILLLPLYPPALIAKQIADLDRATGGRLILGVGVGGEYPQEFSAVQVPVAGAWPPDGRGDPATAATVDCRARHARRPLLPDGDMKIHPAPAQPGGPPIIIAGQGCRPCAVPR